VAERPATQTRQSQTREDPIDWLGARPDESTEASWFAYATDSRRLGAFPKMSLKDAGPAARLLEVERCGSETATRSAGRLFLSLNRATWVDSPPIVNYS
jgi:hypothetical protein